MATALAGMEGASPADMMEVRLLLEPAAAAFAATNATNAEVAAIRDAHVTTTTSGDMPTFENWDAEFHNRIVVCSRNQRSFSAERRAAYCDEHRQIVDALVRRDPEAARDAMRGHLLSVERNLLGR